MKNNKRWILILTFVVSFISVFSMGDPSEKKWNDGREENNSSGAIRLDDFQKTILERHNYYRGIAGIPLMKWNPGIAQNAQKWANQLKGRGCKMAHSSHSFRGDVAGHSYLGENLYWAWSSATVTPDASRAQNSVDSWYSEIADFQYSAKGTNCPLRGKKGMIGHFTQLMWDKSVELGCAHAVCGGTSLVIVCQYGPGGNFNMHVNPPFPPDAAERLNKDPVNQPFGGLPRCDSK